MTNRIRVFAGECTAEFEGTRDRTSRGIIVALVKPDNTVLVHDSNGYSPVAWLTRPASLTIDHSDGTTIEARDGEQQLQIRFHEMYEKSTYPGSVAGVPVGTCSATGEALVRCRGSVVNVETGREYDISSGAVVLDEHCRDCGLPLIRVERGSRFEVCLDRACESIDSAVISAFDRTWSCPECGDALRIRQSGDLIVRCDSQSNGVSIDGQHCETEFEFPNGVVVGTCTCGLPVFETEDGRSVSPCAEQSCDTSSYVDS
ncbi:endonuclease NucS domain-containing protein [Halocatena marina]|uniref:Endonuclease NucS domain-containing protein n=1 Tax=Halocatena marina TaxID=2934937 RepID=A0ABD5YQQ8_9EURY|nr:endonuclease NucS domain-containing protein [Halocatena marina]